MHNHQGSHAVVHGQGTMLYGDCISNASALAHFSLHPYSRPALTSSGDMLPCSAFCALLKNLLTALCSPDLSLVALASCGEDALRCPVAAGWGADVRDRYMVSWPAGATAVPVTEGSCSETLAVTERGSGDARTSDLLPKSSATRPSMPWHSWTPTATRWG